MSASADCSCRARKGLRALPPASVVMCKVTEAACRGVGGRRADGGRKQGGQSAAFYRRGAGPGGRGGRPFGRRRGGGEGGRKEGGRSAAFSRRVPRPGVRAVGPLGRRRAPAVSIEVPARTGTGWLWIIAP